MPTASTIRELQYGDRFYYTSDSKKIVWQVTGADIAIQKIKGFNVYTRQVSLMDRYGNQLQYKHARTNTNVIFLRNIKES